MTDSKADGSVYYDEYQMCSVLDELQNKLPLKYRSLIIGSSPDQHSLVTVGKGQDYGIVMVEIASSLPACELGTLAMFGYSVARALDVSRIVTLPLRKYDLENAMEVVYEIVACVASSVARRFALRNGFLLTTYNSKDNGPIVDALVPASAGSPPVTPPVLAEDAEAADREAIASLNRHSMLRAAMSWTLAKGVGTKVGDA